MHRNNRRLLPRITRLNDVHLRKLFNPNSEMEIAAKERKERKERNEGVAGAGKNPTTLLPFGSARLSLCSLAANFDFRV